MILILSERNKHVSPERQHLLPSDKETDSEVQKMRAELDRLRQDLDLLEDPETICSFGQMAFDGDGVDQDNVQAANWWKIAAEQNHACSQHNLALMYENGQGVPHDLTEAAKWYRIAAEQGHAGSQNNLGALYEGGDGVPQDNMIALDLYRQAAKGGDANAASNVLRLEVRTGRDKYQDIVMAFSDLMAADAPLIGDCSMLPYPKKTILYAIRWVMEDYETKREATTDRTLREGYDQMLPTLSYLLTRLARDWREIDLEDKDAIAELGGCDSFPDWALKLKAKYIDDDKASNEAYDVAIQVTKDKVEFEKRHGKSKENGPRTKKELDEEYNDLAKQLKISLEITRNRNSGH